MSAGVIHLEIVHFREINERWGDAVGDTVLALTVRRALNIAPANTLLADAGASLTVLMLDATPHAVRQMATRLMNATREPVQLGPTEVQPLIRAGWAYAAAGEAGLELLDQAQAAFRAAKDQERVTPAEYGEEVGRETFRTRRMEADLHTAIAEGDLRAYFQPVVDLRDGRVVGLEALVRWPRHPGTMLLPDQFLPVAEAAGLMPDVGQGMLDRVLDALTELRRQPFDRPLRVWINLGAHEVAGADEVLTRISSAIGDGTLNPHEIGFEVTESTVLEDLDSAVESLAALRRLGVEIALDDFGTGYSSLSYLRRLPVTAVKIDRSFVSGLGSDQADEAVVEAVIDLAHALGLRVIAEGVEHQVHVDALVALGADEAQGFLFGPPAPIDELAERLGSVWPGIAGARAARVDRRADALPGYGSPRARLLLAALDTAHDSIVVTTSTGSGPAAHEIVYVNDRFGQAIGIDGRALIGQSLDSILPPTRQADLPGWYADVFAGRGTATREVDVVRADGSAYLCEVTVSPIFDERGSLTHWLHTARDISERRALEDERARFEWMIEQSDSLVVMYDTRGDWLYANAAMRDAIGIGRDASLDGVTNSTVGITSGPLAEIALGEVREQLNATGRWSGPWALDNPTTGVTTDVLCELQQIADPLDAGRSFIVAVGRDITATRARERAGERRRNLAGAVGRLAHRAVEESVEDVLGDLDSSVGELAALLGCDLIYVNLVEHGMLHTAAVWSSAPRRTEPADSWRRSTPVEDVRDWLALVETGRVVTDPPPGSWRDELAAAFPDRPLGAQLMVGLSMDGHLLGVLGLASERERTWAPDELAAVEAFAHVIANLLQRQRTEATLRADVQAATTREAFDRVQMGVAQWALGLDREAVTDGLDVHLQELGELLGADSVTLALMERGELRRRSRWPLTSQSPLGAAPRMTYAEMLAKLPDLEPLIVNDIEEVVAPWTTSWRADPGAPRAAMIVPLGAGGHFDGVLAVVVEHERRRWLDTEVAFVRALAGLISSHIGRVQAEASLRTSQARLEALLDGASDFVLVVDELGIVRYANSAVRRNLGMSMDQIVGAPGFALIHPDDQPLAIQRFNDLMERSASENTRVRAMRANGSVAGWWEILSGSQRDPLVGGTVLTCRDVTSHVLAERAEQIRVARLQHTFELAQRALDIGPDAFLARLDESCASIAAMLGADVAWVVQIDEAREMLSGIGCFGDMAEGPLALPFAEMPAWVERLREPSPVHLKADARDDDWAIEWRERSGCDGEMMTVAMSMAGQLVGEVGVAMHEGAQDWDDDAMAYLRIVADTFAHVLERERLDTALRASEARFRILSETAADVVILIDDRGTIAYVSPSSATLLGYVPADLIGQDATMLLPAGQGDLVSLLDDRSSRDGTGSAELQMRRSDGELIWVAHSTSAVLDARTSSRVTYRISLRDITERKRLETELSWQALHDPLTGLGNRIHLQRRLADATVDAGFGRGLAVLLIDLDKFKAVNDTLGHAHGDEVLRIVSSRLAKLTRPSDTLARTGGDEFVVLCPNTDAHDAVAVGERIVRTLCEPIAAHGAVVEIGASIGVAHASSPSVDSDHLLIEADRAMYAAKERGGNDVVVA